MKRNKGFTLIELLVVIAIIGILSAIVLASLNSARSKAMDAKVQAQISSMRAAAEIYYNYNNNSYGTEADCTTNNANNALFVNTNSGMAGLVTGTTGAVCGSNGTAWAVAAPLVSNSSIYWCADSTGKSASWHAGANNTNANNATLATTPACQ